MSAPTPGPWRVSRDTKQGHNGKKYGLEVCADVPVDQRAPWESAGYVPLCDVFSPTNPSRVADYTDSAIKAQIDARREANARLIAAAPQLLAALRIASQALRSYQYGNAAVDLAKEIADNADAAIRAATEAPA